MQAKPRALSSRGQFKGSEYLKIRIQGKIRFKYSDPLNSLNSNSAGREKGKMDGICGFNKKQNRVGVLQLAWLYGLFYLMNRSVAWMIRSVTCC
jgi:hypothetical protein